MVWHKQLDFVKDLPFIFEDDEIPNLKEVSFSTARLIMNEEDRYLRAGLRVYSLPKKIPARWVVNRIEGVFFEFEMFGIEEFTISGWAERDIGSFELEKNTDNVVITIRGAIVNMKVVCQQIGLIQLKPF